MAVTTNFHKVMIN